uniref:La ribonucleoprotein 6, translational regulator n=1 Tax=Pelodiscus sinensis TaxID=13735 RepID=K7FPM5_PELSI
MVRGKREEVWKTPTRVILCQCIAVRGGENDGDDLDQDWKPPDNELIQKLIMQVEYYFSDENLEKDAFLLKHVRRNKMGYVSVKLLTSFKKVKQLTRDWRTTAYALKYSDTLEMNEDSRKVRRNTPVPVFAGMKPPKKKVVKDKSHDEDPSKSLNKMRSLNKRVEELQYVGDESSANSSSDPESNPTSPLSGRKPTPTNKLSPTTYPNNHLSPNVSPRSSPWNSPSSLRKVCKKSPLADDSKLNPTTSPEISRKCADYSSDSSITPSSSPWVQRRRQAKTVAQEKSPVSSPMLARRIQNADGLPVGVLRLPKGPDGTKGFHNGCKRNKPMKNE